jgi:Protein of unknown function (DUF433)
MHPGTQVPGGAVAWASPCRQHARDQILGDYPYLKPEDIDEALHYAALLAEDETVDLALLQGRRSGSLSLRPRAKLH